MAITIKTPDEIKKMRIAGKLTASVLNNITPFVKKGITTNELNSICHNYITKDLAAIPAPLNYGLPPFPKSICTSINSVVCHGIPDDKKLKNGDIINIDVTIIKDGYHGDSSKMFIIGQQPTIKAKRIVTVARKCLLIGIKAVKAGVSFATIGKNIEKYAKLMKCSVVRDYCGHGIGLNFHEEPQILHYENNKTNNLIMQEGMVFTIEPMINIGSYAVKTSKINHWTVSTKDRTLSAQWEHTILVTKDSAEILTLREEETDINL